MQLFKTTPGSGNQVNAENKKLTLDISRYECKSILFHSQLRMQESYTVLIIVCKLGSRNLSKLLWPKLLRAHSQ